MGTKTCSRCRQEKPTAAFANVASRKNGRQAYCRPCAVEYAHERNEARRKVLDALKSAPCTDCGNQYPPVCMDFDHIGEKLFSIAKARSRGMDWQKVLDEIAKCELVCANCHRVRTRDRSPEPQG